MGLVSSFSTSRPYLPTLFSARILHSIVFSLAFSRIYLLFSPVITGSQELHFSSRSLSNREPIHSFYNMIDSESCNFFFGSFLVFLTEECNLTFVIRVNLPLHVVLTSNQLLVNRTPNMECLVAAEVVTLNHSSQTFAHSVSGADWTNTLVTFWVDIANQLVMLVAETGSPFDAGQMNPFIFRLH